MIEGILQLIHILHLLFVCLPQSNNIRTESGLGGIVLRGSIGPSSLVIAHKREVHYHRLRTALVIILQ
jgi:hypothetical protein